MTGRPALAPALGAALFLVWRSILAFGASESHHLEETIEAGRTAFNRSCAICHSPRGGRPPVATDLRGVTRKRELSWFKGWAARPDGLARHHEPARVKGMKVPDLRLDEEKIGEIFTYLEAEDAAPARPSL